MRLNNREIFSKITLTNLKGKDWLEKQRIAGKITAQTLLMLKKFVEEKTNLSLLEINAKAEDFISSCGATPTFKNYKGFPCGVCISVNKELAHGIPKDYTLKEGDVISFDLGATYQGAIADSAITCIYGEPKSQKHVDLIKTTEESLMHGISAIKIGSQIGVIGDAIYRHARKNGFSVITAYGGHGLDWDTPHASPFIASRSEVNKGIRIEPGLSIAIEPMLVIGELNTKVLDDGWTVVTNDIGAHFEHSVFVHEDNSIEVITSRENL